MLFPFNSKFNNKNYIIYFFLLILIGESIDYFYKIEFAGLNENIIPINEESGGPVEACALYCLRHFNLPCFLFVNVGNTCIYFEKKLDFADPALIVWNKENSAIYVMKGFFLLRLSFRI